MSVQLPKFTLKIFPQSGRVTGCMHTAMMVFPVGKERLY